MHDIRLEDLVRQTLRGDADTLSLTISIDRLERRLKARREARDRRRWLGAAAVAVFAVTSTAAILAWSASDDATVSATPSPSPSTTVMPSLPTPADLLAPYPDAVMLLDRSVGPADGPASPGPSGSPAPVQVDTVKFGGPFVIAIACVGGGDMLAEVSTPSLGIPYTQAHAVCDGRPVYSEYAALPIDPDSTGDAVTVTVPDGRSWRLAIGGLPASVANPPDLPAIEGSAGWHLLSDQPAMQLTAASPRTGARLTLPDAVTRAGVLVQCSGAGTLSVTFALEPATAVPCDPVGVTHRLEFPAVGGEVVQLAATSDRPGVWVRMIVEVDGRITTSYPPAPALPEAVADSPYVAPDANVVGFGTLGSNEQRILEIAGARPGRPAGDLLPVVVSNETLGASLYLLSVSSGEVTRTLVSAPAGALIFDSWADPVHGQIYYGIATEAAIEFRRVAVDGSDDQVVATVAREGQAGFTADLALDGSVFVVDACTAGSGCTRTVVDAATNIGRTTDRAADPICKILGIADGVIIGTTRASCTEETITDVVAVPLDGRPRVVLKDAPREIADAVVVPTGDGVKVVFVSAVDGDGGVTLSLIDVATGTLANLPPGDVGDPRLTPYAASLPDGWVLLAAGSLGDFPWQRALDRPAPVLLDVVTGLRIEMVNLPHWTGNFSP